MYLSVSFFSFNQPIRYFWQQGWCRGNSRLPGRSPPALFEISCILASVLSVAPFLILILLVWYRGNSRLPRRSPPALFHFSRIQPVCTNSIQRLFTRGWRTILEGPGPLNRACLTWVSRPMTLLARFYTRKSQLYCLIRRTRFVIGGVSDRRRIFSQIQLLSFLRFNRYAEPLLSSSLDRE